MFDVGTVVLHPKRPEWGPGKILEVLTGGKVVIYFRDAPEEARGDAIKTISTNHVHLEVAEIQQDPMLDNLPPYRDGEFKGAKNPRLSIDEAVERFLSEHPRGFEDPKYIGEVGGEGERAYKVNAHELWRNTLGEGQAREMLEEGRIEDLRHLVLAVDGKLNLLSVFEKIALRDALEDENAAAAFFDALLGVVETGKPERALFENLIDAVARLPHREGGNRVATWPILTEFPFIARPDHHMLLKPGIMQDCAARLNFDLHYRTELNWDTYERLLEMSSILMSRLAQLGARDLIDIQSFIFLIGNTGGAG
jgi:hypothetical protein